MKKLIILTSLFVLALSWSYGQTGENYTPDDGTIKDNTYHSNDIKWTIHIPSGWAMMDNGKVVANEQKGKQAISEVYDGDIDMKTLKHLINFQKNQFNVFLSTAQRFKEDFAGEYDQQNRELYVLIYNTYTSQGIHVDTASATELVQGLKFSVFKIVVHGSDGTIILRQIMYSRLINGYDFGVTLSYNNEEDKETMMKAWKNSQFKN